MDEVSVNLTNSKWKRKLIELKAAHEPKSIGKQNYIFEYLYELFKYTSCIVFYLYNYVVLKRKQHSIMYKLPKNE